MSLPTDYHRLAQSTGISPSGEYSVGAFRGLSDLLHEHGLPGAAFYAHFGDRVQAGDRLGALRQRLREHFERRTTRLRPITGLLNPHGTLTWRLSPSRKREMERSQDPMAQHILQNAGEEHRQILFGPEHPILQMQTAIAPDGDSSRVALVSHYLPILSHAHAEEISRDWPDDQRAKFLNHLSVAEGKNIPMDHNAPEPTPADPNAPEHAAHPGKKAKLARKKPVAKNEKALVLLGGIKMALQESANRRGMPFESSQDLNARTVKLYREMERALNNPDLSGTVGFSALHQLLGRIGAPSETATGGLTNTIALPSVKDVAGLLLNPRHGLLNTLEDRAEARGGYGGTTAGFNPTVSRKPSGFVELPKDQQPLQTDPQTIARGVAEALPGKVAPPSDPGTVKPVDGRSFRSRANKVAAAQELPKPKYEVVPEAEGAPVPLAPIDRPNSKHADAISKALFGPGDAKAKVAAAHSALEALGMTNRGSRHRAIKQHIEARRAATKLRRVRLNRAREVHKAWRRDEAPLFAVAEHLHDEGHPAAEFFSYAGLNHDAPQEQDAHMTAGVRGAARGFLPGGREVEPGKHFAHLTHVDGVLRAHVFVPVEATDPFGAMFSAHTPIRSKQDGRNVLGAFPTLAKYVEHSSLPETHEPAKLARPKQPSVHPGPTATEITNKPGANRIDPQIAGTRLAYHLADLIREFKGDAGKAAHPERAGAIVALAKDALLGKRDAYAKLGEHLTAIGHPHGSAYNWNTVSRSLRDDDLMKRFVAEQFAHVKGTGLMHDEVWRRVQKHYSLESATAGTDAHNEFWKRATAYFKKHHGGDLKDLKARINNSMYRVQKLRDEGADTSKEGVRGMRGMRGTYYGDAGGEGQKHHMRFKREK